MPRYKLGVRGGRELILSLSLNHVLGLLTRELCMGILGTWAFAFSFLIASKYLSQDLWGGEVAGLMQELGTFGSLS